MNLLLVKVGLLVSAAAFLFFLLGRTEPQHTYTYENYNDPNTVCCICLEEFNSSSDREKMFFLPCRHRLHRDCVKRLFQEQGVNNRSCPYCRRRVPESHVSKCQ